MLHRIGGRIPLCMQRLFRNMLHVELASGGLLEDSYDIQRCEGLGTANLDDLIPGRGILHAGGGEGRYIEKRNPAHQVLTTAVDGRLSVCRIEAESGREPYFNKGSGAQDGVLHSAVDEVLLHGALGLTQCAGG